MSAIKEAKKSFHMEMYHLSDKTIIQALIDAKKRGIDVQVILDHDEVEHEKQDGAFHTLHNAGVTVYSSSKAFVITHTKSFVVDGKTAYIMSLNLTTITPTVRDAGYISHQNTTVKLFEDLFTTDVEKPKTSGMKAPSYIPENIVLSPVDSHNKIENFIKSAKSEILLEVENISDDAIIKDLEDAVKSGVHVEVLVPRCDMTSNNFDMPAARELSKAGVTVHMMPAPMTAETPYIHQKAIVVDRRQVFLGLGKFHPEFAG